jgi:prepilin-type N-terminal cleavage/methylation domain-containing protein
MIQTARDQSAFSLVELSIVLVILGLLVGGVLMGQSLIRAAELRRVVTDYNKYTTAVQSFRDKYFALPGDMTNAQNFWGVQDPTPATCRTMARAVQP